MHDTHDPDLIASYADGDLEGDSSAVEAQLSACAECRAEFDLHRDLRAMLAAAPEVTMSDDERSSLRAAVHAKLDAGAPVVPLARARQWRWMAVGSVAAAALVVVGVAGILTTGGGDDAAIGDEPLAVSEAADTQRSELADEFATQGAATTAAATETTEAMTATEDAGGEGAPNEGAGYFAYSDAQIISEQELELMVDTTLAGLSAAVAPEELTADWFNEAEKPTPECVASVTDPIYAVITATVDGDEIEVLFVKGEPDGEYRAEIFTVADCLPR